MRSLTCVVLFFTVVSLIAVSAAQQPSPTAVPKLIDDSDPLPLPAGMTTEAIAGSTAARLLPCAADGWGSGVADSRRPDPNADTGFLYGKCHVAWTAPATLDGSCLVHLPGTADCITRYDPQQCPRGVRPSRLIAFPVCANLHFFWPRVDVTRSCAVRAY
jgi:hypothetical protein